MRRPTASILTAILVLMLTPGAASAIVANCRNSGSFARWLADFKKEAVSQGISRRAIAAAAPFLTYSQRIINIDRGQRIFTLNFLQFSKKVIPKYRLVMGRKQIKKHTATFARVERQYGVPAPVITAFWGLESDFGANMGKDRTLPAIATLAYDCRRSERFREQLLGALRLIDRGDLRPGEMVGSWAGELGQTQMMPAEYNQNAVDYDGDGRRDLLRSVPDVAASTANYLTKLGWQRGLPWLEEVRAPQNLPWQEADLAIQHPRSQWVKWGVRRTHGKPLPSDNVQASLVLPMGRLGPAFLAYGNFQVYLKWNESLVYSTTAAYYATRLAGAPAMQRGSGNIPGLSYNQIHELQRILAKKGHDVGKVDGIIGANTRAAVKKVQLQLGLPADSWPTPELLARLRGGR
jgi:lytic murein transglycosylase